MVTQPATANAVSINEVLSAIEKLTGSRLTLGRGAWRQGDGIAARFADALPDQAEAPTVTGPRLVELCFQSAGLWEAGREGRLALPGHVDAVRLSAEPAERPGLLAVARPDGRGGFGCVVRDRDGAVVLRVDGYRTVPLPDPLPDDVCAPFRSVMND